MINALPTRVVTFAAASLVAFCFFGCSSREPQIQPEEVQGTWELDSKNLNADGYSVDDFQGFSVTINPKGDFSAVGIPVGLFLNKGPGKADFKGGWKLRYDGYNYIDFGITNLPGYTGGTYGMIFEWKDGRRVIRLSQNTGDGLIYIFRSKPISEQAEAPNRR